MPRRCLIFFSLFDYDIFDAFIALLSLFSDAAAAIAFFRHYYFRCCRHYFADAADIFAAPLFSMPLIFSLSLFAITLRR